MPATLSKPVKTKWIAYRCGIPEHTAIKTDAAQLGITVGSYIQAAVEQFRKASRKKKRRAA